MLITVCNKIKIQRTKKSRRIESMNCRRYRTKGFKDCKNVESVFLDSMGIKIEGNHFPGHCFLYPLINKTDLYNGAMLTKAPKRK